MRHQRGCTCHPEGGHYHDSPARASELEARWAVARSRYRGRPRPTGDGSIRNRSHDAGLKREVKIWREEIELSGGQIVDEFNTRDLSRMVGRECNGPMSYAEKQEFADRHGFSMHAGSIQVPDHRIVIVWEDGRREVKDLEHINPLTYNSAQRRGKFSMGAKITGLSVRNSPSGRRVKDGPDMLSTLLKPARM